jgi:membrane associated rhomboid family serine protease
VPEDRWPFLNWLIISAAIVVFVFQTLSISERETQLPKLMKEYENVSVEDVAKDFEVDEHRLKEIEQAAEKYYSGIARELTFRIVDPAKFKESFVKRAILEEYFVWGKIRPFILHGWELKGLFGHIWLHAGILHLLGNMLFLWIFGNAVCAKIGNFRYFPIYVALGLLAGISQMIFVGGSGLGASGAINGIVGMFLVFFPENEITCYFVFFFPLLIRPYVKEFCLSSIWVILLWLAFDIWGAVSSGGHVAYFAHLGGFAGGFCLAILMLKFKMVTMERHEKSLLQLIADYRNPPKEEPSSYGGYLDMIQKGPQEEPKPVATIPFVPKTISFDPPPPKEEFIRFTCPCGKHLKMPSKYAGKMGKCPHCKNRVRIPDK